MAENQFVLEAKRRTRRRKMKAYKAWDEFGDGYSTIVFAENIKEAKKIALSTDACEDADFVNVRVKREKSADSLYKGHCEIDWDDKETRLALVRDLGWSCLETSYECESCPARQYCRWHEEEGDEA